MRTIAALCSAFCLVLPPSASLAAVQPAHVSSSSTLRNSRILASFDVVDGHLRLDTFQNLADQSLLAATEPITVYLRNPSGQPEPLVLMVAGKIQEQAAPVDPSAAREADHHPGRSLCAELASTDDSLHVRWCAILRENAHYLRQEFTLTAAHNALPLSRVELIRQPSMIAEVVGKVPGSPGVDGNFFFAMESPMAHTERSEGRLLQFVERTLPLEAGNSVHYSSVLGVAAAGQMRRDFFAYLEQERAHPYRTFLHPNTWYDLGYGKPFDEAGVLDRIQSFAQELVNKRGVQLDSYLFDDGWDDPQTLWQFHQGFPQGFARVRAQAARSGFGVGVWLSPWGGYSTAKQARVAAGVKAGYETVDGGFALSAPKYYALFEATCLRMMAEGGVNQFKFDGTGNASKVFTGSLFDSDFAAALHLMERLRQANPAVYINLTTGTWPSPFFLRTADSIWRGGDDHDFAGVGSWRQRWMTYRDQQTYSNVVQPGPLYPLNSLMLHGLIYAQFANHLDSDPESDFAAEVQSYFATGTQLQELYLTPSLLKPSDWDALAASARWARQNASILSDSHWVGGDPGKLQVYGWAAWRPEKGILTLRNPSNQPQSFQMDLAKAFELPAHAPQTYRATVFNRLQNPAAGGQNTAPEQKEARLMEAGRMINFDLKPFEVLTLELLPESGR